MYVCIDIHLNEGRVEDEWCNVQEGLRTRKEVTTSEPWQSDDESREERIKPAWLANNVTGCALEGQGKGDNLNKPSLAARQVMPLIGTG
jgi:hypothetical protein